MVPINRSVGLKAKPSKPITEVLRPVAAKYGLRLSELVVRLVSEQAGEGRGPSAHLSQLSAACWGPACPQLSSE